MIEPGLWDTVMRLRSRGISDTRIIAAIERAPRSRFVPDALRARAYHESPLPIPCGQAMLSPLATAQLAQLLDVRDTDKALLVGLGSGYLAALLAPLARRVYAVDRYRELVRFADGNLARAGVAGVVTRHGDGRLGWRGQAPFDRIVVACGLLSPPKALMSQLADGGRLLASLGGTLSHYDGTVWTPVFPLALPPVEPGRSAAL